MLYHLPHVNVYFVWSRRLGNKRKRENQTRLIDTIYLVNLERNIRSLICEVHIFLYQFFKLGLFCDRWNLRRDFLWREISERVGNTALRPLPNANTLLYAFKFSHVFRVYGCKTRCESEKLFHCWKLKVASELCLQKGCIFRCKENATKQNCAIAFFKFPLSNDIVSCFQSYFTQERLDTIILSVQDFFWIPPQFTYLLSNIFL